MEILTLRDEEIFASNCYLLISDNSFSVVDPSVSYDVAVRMAPRILNLKPEYVLLTHGHIDHIWEIDSYVKVGCKVLVSEADGPMLSRMTLNCALMIRGKIDSYNGEYTVISDMQTINTCGIDLKVIATPGHTKGSVCYVSDSFIFTGDTLFAGGAYGRFDLPTGNATELSYSLRKLSQLSGDLILYSGHGEVSTLEMSK